MVVSVPRLLADTVITYVRVERPQLDVVHVVLGAFALTGALVLIACAIGVVLAVSLIVRRRRERPFQPGLDLGR